MSRARKLLLLGLLLVMPLVGSACRVQAGTWTFYFFENGQNFSACNFNPYIPVPCP